MFKNMKIAISDEQPLDEVVKELELIGYEKYSWYGLDEISHIVTWDDGTYSDYSLYGLNKVGELEQGYEETNLTELRSMSIETLKEME